MSATLSIVIVNWNGIGFLPACLTSIAENRPTFPFEIVIVDNASSDGSVEWIGSDEAKEILGDIPLVLIANDQNIGFGRANNMAFERTNSPYVFVLNPDTRVKKDAIENLVNTFKYGDTIGMSAPRLLWEDGTAQPSVSGFPPSPFSILIDGFQLYRFIPKRFIATRLYGNHWSYDQRREVPIVAGAAMMCKREMIIEAGGFDPAIHMYGEDLEWCIRIKRFGWTVSFEPTAEVYHVGGKSTAQRWEKSEIGVIQEEAIIAFNRKCSSPTRNFLNGLTSTFVMTCHLIRWKLMGKNTSTLKRMIRLHMENCRSLLTKTS